MPQSKTVNIILTCNYSPWSKYRGGGQKSTHMLASALSQKGFEVRVVYSKAPWEKVNLPATLPYKIQWAFFLGIKPGVSSPLRFLNGIFYYFLIKRISNLNTIIHGNGDEASLLWLIPHKKKFLFTSRNTYPAYLSGLNWKKLSTWLKIFFTEPRDVAVAMAIFHANKVTCTSRFSLQQLQDCFALEATRSAIIPNGLDPVFLQYKFQENNQKDILFFGRLAINKGADHALEAYALLPENLRTQHGLTFAGTGPLHAQLLSRSKELGLSEKIKFSGWVSNEQLGDLLVQHRLVFLPSLEESFGNAILETLITGQQLVTTSACAIPEVAGAYGIQIPSGDIYGFAKALENELQRQRTPEEITQQIEYYRSQYTWEAVASLYLQEYEK